MPFFFAGKIDKILKTCYTVYMITKRIIAFDIGDKRIGVAVTDPFNEYALPSETYWRVGKFEEDVYAVLRIATEKDAGAIVCGLPLNFDGTESVQTIKTQKFIDAMRAHTDIPVYAEDERFTTMQAHEIQRICGVKRKDRKNSVDSIAASYIL
ncbi:MAG: Holliday junction resolvase RuvX, partial [Clostridia bacterium]|nr:Holliday junction resolvase RuvX [Clostridia bacterium]